MSAVLCVALTGPLVHMLQCLVMSSVRWRLSVRSACARGMSSLHLKAEPGAEPSSRTSRPNLKLDLKAADRRASLKPELKADLNPDLKADLRLPRAA